MAVRKVLLVIVALAALSGLAFGARDQLGELAQRRAQLVQGGGPGGQVVFSVGGQPVTQGEYLATVEEVKFNMANMAAMDHPLAQARLDVMSKYPAEVIAFAALLEERALLARAKEEGITVPVEEITEQVLETRRLYREGNIPALQRLVQIYGEQLYFEEIAPRMYEREMTVGRYVARALAEVPDEARDQARRDLVLRVLASTPVSVLVENPAFDVRKATEYLAEYWSAR